ncbi:tetratricopeptide repeat protein [Aeromonas caviae]|uniref:tetratricopeptide repeat protein n=1 Tax=Aeromonas caviae TaxID=648 RepID=UPI00191C9BB5|nr:tetratricopeptide repeat protein [Aeromonas caviae]MBL0485266.1 tetratricopeptide repeat protein [Aeromonas caviae]
MSVINQMLKDLDRRQQEAEGAAVYVAPVRQQGWWMLVLTLLCTLALGILGWRTWIFWQQSQRASLPAAQVEALRTAPAAAPSAPLAVVATTQAVSSAAPMAKVPAASAESTAARVAPSAAEQAPADEGNPQEALGDETIPSDEELQPDLYAELAAEQSAEEAPAPAAPRKPGILKIETVELSDAELATLAERKATTAMAKGRMQEAQDGYYEVLAHDPHNQGAREQLAGLLYGAGRLTEAAQVLEEGLRLDPAQADLRLLLARVAISGGDRQKALDWLTGYQPDIASNLDYYATWAGLAQELGQPVQASEMYVRLLRQQPDQGRWWLGLGVAEDGQGHRQRALDAYRNAQLHGNLGEASTQWLEQRIGQLTH